MKAADWREIVASPPTLRRVQSEMTIPPSPAPQLSGAAQYLKERNGERVRALIRAGARDERALAQALGDWAAALAGDDSFPILFLGLVLTLDCSFDPRCLYCNQRLLPCDTGLEQWKRLVAEVAKPTPPYLYLTGGDPLLLGEAVWGDDGLAAFATQLGCAVNINTNATLIDPRLALQIVRVGVAKLHISVDSVDTQVQDELLQGKGRAEAVWRGIFNLQIARELLGANHPQIHINCVLTRRNLFQVPALVDYLLEVRKIPSADSDGKITSDPAFGDFAFHLIPVGGSENAWLRPSEEEWKQFYTRTWESAEQIWEHYQAAIGVPRPERKVLAALFPFANPYLRVDHGLTLDEYCRLAAQGVYWKGALTPRCHVAPSQAFVLPDGSQYWCGAHAIRRPPSLGNVREATVRENIRRNIERLSELPSAACANCAGATCVINQAMERALNNQVAEWLRDIAPSKPQ